MHTVQVTGAAMGPDGKRSRKPQAVITGGDGNPACSADVEVKKWRCVKCFEVRVAEWLLVSQSSCDCAYLLAHGMIQATRKAQLWSTCSYVSR